MNRPMEYCKGCRTKERVCTIRLYTQYGTKERVSIIGDCPCGICLVKGVCKVACPEYLDFSVIKE
jgi:hypothetical protein